MLSLDTTGELFALDPARLAPFLEVGARVSEACWEELLAAAGVTDPDERQELEDAVERADGEVLLVPEGADFFFGCRAVGAAAVAAAQVARWVGSGGRTLSSVASAHPPERLLPARLGTGADDETLAAWQGLFAAIGCPCPALGAPPPRPVWFEGYEDDHVGLLPPHQVERIAAGLGGGAAERAVTALGISGCEADDVRSAAAFFARAAARGCWVLGAQAAT